MERKERGEERLLTVMGRDNKPVEARLDRNVSRDRSFDRIDTRRGLYRDLGSTRVPITGVCV